MASSVAAKTDWVTAQLSTTEIEAIGNVTQEARLLALSRIDSSEPSQTPDVSFDGSAAFVRVETYESDPSVEAEGIRYNPTPPFYEPTVAEYADAVFWSHGQTKSTYKFVIVAVGETPPTISVTSNCAEFVEPDRQSLEAEWTVARPASPVAADVSQAVRWRECGTSHVKVTGDYVVVLWQVDAVLQAGGEEVAIPSGYDESGTVVGSTVYPTVSHVRQQYLFVTGGVLTFTMDSTTHFAYLDAPRITTDESVSFADAVGQVSRGAEIRPVEASVLSVTGRHVSLSPRGGGLEGPLSVQVGGFESAQADGQPLSFAVSSEANGAAWQGGFVVLGLVALLAAGRPLAVGQLIRRASRLEPHQADRVERLCNWALALGSRSPRAYWVRGRARAAQLELEPAMRDLEEAWRRSSRSAELQASIAGQAWLICAELGRASQRNEWLERLRQAHV